MQTNVKWTATLTHVREVSLLGTADLVFWKDRLSKEELVPAEREGKAQVMIVAADAKYMGIRFSELSLSVLVHHDRTGIRLDGAYLLRAWNSRRAFAFCERVLFRTPYRHGDVRVSASARASIQLADRRELVFLAEMQPDDPTAPSREPLCCGPGGWEGPIFLPGKGAATGHDGKFFFARITGQTKTYPFLHGQDSVTIKPVGGCEILAALLESNFAAEQWAVRENATHAKSKTYRRTDHLQTRV